MAPNRHQAVRVPHLRTHIERLLRRLRVVQVQANPHRLGTPVVLKALLQRRAARKEPQHPELGLVHQAVQALAHATIIVESNSKEEQERDRRAGPHLFIIRLTLDVVVKGHGGVRLGAKEHLGL